MLAHKIELFGKLNNSMHTFMIIVYFYCYCIILTFRSRIGATLSSIHCHSRALLQEKASAGHGHRCMWQWYRRIRVRPSQSIPYRHVHMEGSNVGYLRHLSKWRRSGSSIATSGDGIEPKGREVQSKRSRTEREVAQKQLR